MGHQEIKVPPQNLEAEKSVLGSMLIDEEAIGLALEILNEAWFYENSHRKIYSAILDLYNNRKNVDLITLSDKLRSDGQLDMIGGGQYLSSIIDVVPTSANVQHYAHIVKEKGILRKLIHNATHIVNGCYEFQGEITQVVDEAERLIFEVADLKQNTQSVHIKELVKRTIEVIDTLYQRKELITGLATHFIDFNRYTSGLQPSDLIIVAGRPSMGKSAFASAIAEHVAIETKKPVAFFSLEMSKEQLVQRMLCSQARVDAHKVRSGFLAASDWPKLTAAAGKLSSSYIYIDDSPAISPLELRAKARRLKSHHDIQLLVLDYLQLMRGNI